MKWSKRRNHIINWINSKIKLIAVFSIRDSESYLIFNYEKEFFFILFLHSILARHIIFDDRNKITFYRISEMKTSWTRNDNRDVCESQSRCFRKVSINFMKIDLFLKRLLFTSQMNRNMIFFLKFMFSWSLFLNVHKWKKKSFNKFWFANEFAFNFKS